MTFLAPFKAYVTLFPEIHGGLKTSSIELTGSTNAICMYFTPSCCSIHPIHTLQPALVTETYVTHEGRPRRDDQ